MVAWWKNWWTRPYGGRMVMVIALPLIISTGSLQIMHFCDRMFLLWHDKNQMAASMPAGILLFSLICFPLGVASYTNAFVAQYEGAGHPRRIGLAVWQGVFIGLIAYPMILTTIPFVKHVFLFAGHSELLTKNEVTYYRIAAFGSGAMIITGALSAFFSGRGKTRPVMFVGVTSAGLNIVLDYLLIFGHLGFPMMGIAGAALATTIAQWYAVVAYIVLMSRRHFNETYGLRAGCRFSSSLFVRFWKYGGPAGLQFFIEIASFSGFIILMGRISNEAAAATSLAFNMNGLSFIPMIGMGIAVTTLVGQCLGANKPQEARRVTWTALAIGLVYTGFFGVAFLVCPNVFLSFHSAGANPQDFEPIREATITLMRFIAFFCIFDCFCAILVGTLKGAGDTRYVFLVTTLVAPTAVIIIGVGVVYFGWGLYASWATATIWIMLQGMAYLIRVLGPKWENMRVIEHEFLPPTPAEPGTETVHVY